jgi:hypothetical protein
VLCALRGTQAPLELLEVVGVLPPVTEPQVGAVIGSQFDDFARGVNITFGNQPKTNGFAGLAGCR